MWLCKVLPVWHTANVVRRMNEVTLCWTQLYWDDWQSLQPPYVTKPTWSNPPCIPAGLLNRVPALKAVRRVSKLPCLLCLLSCNFLCLPSDYSILCVCISVSVYVCLDVCVSVCVQHTGYQQLAVKCDACGLLVLDMVCMALSLSVCLLHHIRIAESEPYCHSGMFGCLSVIPQPTAYHDWSITTKFGQTCVSLFGSSISHTFGARWKNMENFAKPYSSYNSWSNLLIFGHNTLHWHTCRLTSAFLICALMSKWQPFLDVCRSRHCCYTVGQSSELAEGASADGVRQPRPLAWPRLLHSLGRASRRCSAAQQPRLLFLPLRTWLIVPYDLSVCLFVQKVYCGKTADWNWMPFGIVSGVGRVIGVLDGGGDRWRGRVSFSGEFGASHCNQWGLCCVVVRKWVYGMGWSVCLLVTAVTHTHTHTQPFSALWKLSGTTRVSRYQKKHSPTTLIVVINHPYLLSPSTTTHGILRIQSTCSTVFFRNLSPSFLWSTFWPGTLHFILHTFLHPIIVFFSQHMPIPSQPVPL